MEATCEPNIPKRFTPTAGSEEDTLKPSTSCMMGLDYVRPLATPLWFGKILGLQIFTPQLVGK